VEAAIYFCCLEALQNAAKHAAGRQATVRFRLDGSRLAFEVADEGAGFDATAAAGGTGLQGMADRLEAIGGRLEVRSAPGAGTIVAGSVPVGAAG
jgi:signal transduction histidine kinase